MTVTSEATHAMSLAKSCILYVRRLSENAVVPCKATELAAGYDLSSAHDAVVPARGQTLVKTDLAIGIPEGCYGRVAPRSGLSVRKCLNVGAGVIDADYRGNVGILLQNASDQDIIVTKGERVAQLVLEMIANAHVKIVDSLPDTERGSGGFGSTGTTEIINHVSPVTDRACEDQRIRLIQYALDFCATSVLPDKYKKLIRKIVLTESIPHLEMLEKVLAWHKNQARETKIKATLTRADDELIGWLEVFCDP